MNSKTYDILKFIAQIVLPAIGTLYFALAGIWNFPYGEQIVGTIAAIDAFLGAILGISSARYYKQGKDMDGTLVVDASDPNSENWMFKVDDDISLEDLAQKGSLKLKIEDGNYEAKH